MPFLLANWRVILLGLALASSAAFFKLWRSEVSSHEKYVAEINAQMQVIRNENERKQKESDDVSKLAGEGWQRTVDYIRATYSDRMRQYARGAGLQPLPAATKSIDAIPADALPLGEQCAETTGQLEALQDWVREQHAIR